MILFLLAKTSFQINCFPPVYWLLLTHAGHVSLLIRFLCICLLTLASVENNENRRKHGSYSEKSSTPISVDRAAAAAVAAATVRACFPIITLFL